MRDVEDAAGELERRIAAGRVAKWFNSELVTLLRLLRQTVTLTPGRGDRRADADAAALVQAAARDCSARVSSLLSLRHEPVQKVSASVKEALHSLLAAHPVLRERGVRAEGLDEAMLPLSPAILRSALKALLENACEASDAAPELEVSVGTGDSRALWVKSDGGLAPDHARHGPFPFFSTKPGHTGLGLPVAHVAADNQGGRLEIVPGTSETRIGLVFPADHAPAVRAAADDNVSFACHLSAGLAHDVNNALMAALGWAEILADARDDAEREEAITTLSQAADYMEAMSYLLPYDEGPLASTAVLDLASAIERMRPLLRAVLEHKADRKIALRVHSVVGARVTMSEDALRAVILRLAENARDAMPSGGTWTISCDVRPEHTLLTLTADQGGDQLGEVIRKGGLHAAALGLAVARDLVRASGGSLEVDGAGEHAASPHGSRQSGLPIPSARIRLPGAN